MLPDSRRAAAGRAPQGKLDTESLLKERDVNWTSVRPVYMCASVASLLCMVGLG